MSNLPFTILTIVSINLLFSKKENLYKLNLCNLNRKDGNNWNSGPAPPPPPGTSAHKGPSPKSGGNNSPSDSGPGGGSKKSGIGGGGIAGIIISMLVVGAIIAFFLVKKRRSRRSSADIEKLDNQPFAPLSSSNEKQGKLYCIWFLHSVEHCESSVLFC